MPLEPKPAVYPRIRKAVKLYKITSVITGVMLLLLCAEMILKYAFHLELYGFGNAGFLHFAPMMEVASGEWESTGDGANLSTGILIAHGWFYVVYLFSCFQVWSLMRWLFPKFLLLALGGVIPLLSFFLEVRVAREVETYLAAHEVASTDPVEAHA